MNPVADFYKALNGELKDPSIETAAPKLFKNNFQLYPDEIYPYMKNPNPRVASYAKALMVFNLHSFTDKKPEFVKYILEAASFPLANKDHEKNFYYHLDSVAGSIIRDLVERVNAETKQLAELANKIKDSDSTFTIAFMAMELKLTSILWSRLGIFYTDKIDDRLIEATLEHIVFFSGLGYEMRSVRDSLFGPIISFVQYRNGIIPNDFKYAQNVEKDIKYLDQLKKFTINNPPRENADEEEKKADENMYQEYKKEIEDILLKLDNPEPEVKEEKKAEKKLVPKKVKTRRIPAFMQTKIKFLDMTRFEFIDLNPTAYLKTGEYHLSFYLERYDGQDVLCKIYDIQGTSSLDKIYTEIKCYQALSDSINDTTCFLRYYGTLFEEARIILVMEPLRKSLHTKIEEQKNSGEPFVHQQVMRWIASLTRSLNIMEHLNIYHGDISPVNILIDEKTLSLKIINFMDIIIDEGESTYTVKSGQNHQDAQAFKAPDPEDQSPKYKDIYSLGLVFLQLLTLGNLQIKGVSDEEGELNKLIDSIKEKDMKDLITEMLNKTPRARPKLSVVEEKITDSMTHSHYS